MVFGNTSGWLKKKLDSSEKNSIQILFIALSASSFSKFQAILFAFMIKTSNNFILPFNLLAVSIYFCACSFAWNVCQLRRFFCSYAGIINSESWSIESVAGRGGGTSFGLFLFISQPSICFPVEKFPWYYLCNQLTTTRRRTKFYFPYSTLSNYEHLCVFIQWVK